MEKKQAIFCWSGGKDSSLALYEILQQGEYQIKYLLTTVNENFKRISMHGVREELLDKQAQSIGIPLKKMFVKEGSYEEYERNMETLLSKAKEEGINYVIFGDIFLEDLKKYREDNLAKVNMLAVFPLWKKDTTILITNFIALGFKTITCCTNDLYLGENMVGAEIDQDFLQQLPENVDACGENGEFHSFCFDGPIFEYPITFTIGEKIYKPLEVKGDGVCSSEIKTKGFWYCDLIPGN
ncbi:MAG TPA: diphthine--ammonia ligase [Pedobacter sp.]|jgi:uncharacterized protein (TIGR00290 family)